MCKSIVDDSAEVKYSKTRSNSIYSNKKNPEKSRQTLPFTLWWLLFVPFHLPLFYRSL